MITPSFSLTATERVLPRLALDFTTASLDPRVTFTRTGNTATVVNSSGLIAPINADLPRFDFDPITLVCKGLLIEESRSNLILRSQELDTVPWVGSVTANSATAPDGTTTADTVSSSTHPVTVTAGAAITASIFLKKNNNNWFRFTFRSADFVNGFRIWVNLDTGSAGAANSFGTGVYTSSNVTSFNNGWYRVSLVGNIPSTAGVLELRSVDADNGGTTTGTAYAWGSQLEAGAFATSYIPTVASTVTRSADTAVMTSTNFSDWYNATEGTFVISGQRVFTGNIPGFPWLFSVNDNTSNNQMGVLGSGGTTTIFPGMKAAGADQLSFVTGNWNANPRKVAFAYKENSTQFAFNATASATDTSCLVPSVSRMSIGNNLGASFWSGTYAYLYYYPQRLTSSELAAFTK
jgi:hypothetical protein